MKLAHHLVPLLPIALPQVEGCLAAEEEAEAEEEMAEEVATQVGDLLQPFGDPTISRATQMV